MPQNTAQSQKLTKKQRKGIAFRQKLGKNRKAGKLGDLHSENAPVPESDIVSGDEADLEASKNINPNADDSPSDRRRSETLNGKVQQRQDQKQKQSSGEGDVKSKRDVEFGADTRTRTGSISGSGTERPSKKRKRPQVEAGGANLDRNADSDADTNADAPSKPKRRKQKPSEEEDETVDDSEGNIENGDAKSSLKHKTRYILFIGNLKYTTTEEAIQAHFAHIDPPPTIRLLTPKPSSMKSKSSTTTKSKGCAFLEFTSHASLQHALKLHHSALDGRQINVELTAGGGGKSSTRLEKLKGRNRKLEVQRNKHLQKSTVDPSSDPTTSQGQRHSSTSAEAGDEDTTHRGGKKHNLNSSSKKQRGLKKRKDKNLGTGVNSIPVG
ncbi:hypothetical protein A7U60_g5015 [Sanghuangporus baumii]|uniref:RRM domain-containing protein n=1 Tax=Sanghuangporus baumii TaxID=108892 RepID=A0A9Q5HXN1_SANBA|nr:hypothetical protein A7U60_g5015 [Sanghuangporus baumii]